MNSTSSFALSTRPVPTGFARQGGYDPKKKTGLLPASGASAAPRGADNGGGGATYVIGGNILNTRTEGGLRHHGDEHLGEKIGRRGAEKRKKRDEDRAAEESLKRLLGREGIQHSTGGKYLAQLGVDVGKGKGKGEKKGEEKEEVSRAFSAKRIKAIGFDPTIGVGQRRPDDRAKRVSPKPICLR
jgi:minichromosome maintenance protein 10